MPENLLDLEQLVLVDKSSEGHLHIGWLILEVVLGVVSIVAIVGLIVCSSCVAGAIAEIIVVIVLVFILLLIWIIILAFVICVPNMFFIDLKLIITLADIYVVDLIDLS